MRIFCSPEVLEFLQNDAKGAFTQARLNSWLDALEHRPGVACMPGQVEHFRFPDTARPGGLDINWVGFRINAAARLICAVVNVPGVGRCFFALDFTKTHDYQKTLVENQAKRQGYLKDISNFLSPGGAIAAASSSSAASGSAVDASLSDSRSFKRIVQHGQIWLSPRATQIELMNIPADQGVLCFAPPGAGKTMIAVQRAIALAQQGLTVLVYAPTQRLAEALRKEFEDQGVADRVSVLTFEDVLKLSKIPQGQRLVDFEFFRQWCAERSKILGGQNSQKKLSFNTALIAGESLLWQEFEYVFMQTPDWRSPSDAHLSESQYFELGEKQSRIPQEQRVNIYQLVFVPFLDDIKSDSTLYYPPLVAHTLSLTEPSAALKFDALVLDEVQKVHPWVSTYFLKLLNKPLAAGHFFICGDAHQGVECQQLRMAETLTSYLEGQEASFSIHHLSVNHRSSQAVARVALQALAVEKQLLGSMEKATHQCAAVNEDAPEGSVEVLSYNAELKKRIELDAEAYVLIPDESCREAAVQRWPAGQVATLSEFAGLSGETIVMYGFGDYFKKDLGGIGGHFADKCLPSWDTHSAFSRKGIDYAQRTCLQSIYTAASRAMVALYIIDSQPGFLTQIVENSYMGVTVSAVSAAAEPAAARVSTPKEWFYRAKSDFSNELIDNARAILSDEIKMGDAYQEINEALQSFDLAEVLSKPFESYLPVKMAPQPSGSGQAASAAGGKSKRSKSNSSPPVAPGESAHHSAAGGAPKLPKPKSPPGVLSPAQQKWVNEFVLTKANLQILLDMKDKWEHYREHLLFLAEVGDSKESIFIKYVLNRGASEFLSTISRGDFLDKISPLGLNHLCRSAANLNKSLAYFLCTYPNGRALLRANPVLAAKISEKSLNALLQASAGAEVMSPGAAFWLCATEDGRALLRANPVLAAKIDSKALNHVFSNGQSCVYALCCSVSDGIELLSSNAELASKIHPDALNSLIPEGQAVSGKSGTLFLCGNSRGRTLLLQNPELVGKITSEALNAILPMSAGDHAGLSALYFLCVHRDGIDILKANPELLEKITADGLNAILPKSAGEFGLDNTVAYVLANSEKGKLLIADNIDLAKKIRRSDFDRIFPGTDGESVECRLERYIRENTQVVSSIGSMFARTQTHASSSTNPESSRP